MFDVIIIGGGPAGLTAGLYACRAGLNTVLIEKMVAGGQAATTPMIENYPGFSEGISGFDIGMKMEEHAVKFGLQVVYDDVTNVALTGDIKTVRTAVTEYQAKAVILCMGAKFRPLGVRGELELRGRGVSYCAVCDGAFFRDKTVAVVGGGNTALEDAMYLATYAKKVYLIHRRDAFRGEKILQDLVAKEQKIERVMDTVIEKINGHDEVQSVYLRNVKTDEYNELALDGLFVAVGQEPDTALIKGQVPLDDYGFVQTDDHMRTSVPGIFAAGDIRLKALRQVVTAASDGATAAHCAGMFLKEKA